MSIKDKIIVQLYFPNFISPPSSRFESLFNDLIESNENKKNDLSYLIYPERIIRGEDKRTSILIKNIPKNIKKNDIRNLVEKYEILISWELHMIENQKALLLLI